MDGGEKKAKTYPENRSFYCYGMHKSNPYFPKTHSTKFQSAGDHGQRNTYSDIMQANHADQDEATHSFYSILLAIGEEVSALKNETQTERITYTRDQEENLRRGLAGGFFNFLPTQNSEQRRKEREKKRSDESMEDEPVVSVEGTI